MSVIITDQASTIEFLFSTGERNILDKDNLNIKESGTLLRKHVYITNSPGFLQTAENDVIKLHYSEVTSPAVASNQELIDVILGYKASSGYTMGDVRITDGSHVLDINADGSLNVDATLQDQTTPVVIARFTKLEASTQTSTPMSLYDTSVFIVSTAGFSIGKVITIFDPEGVRFTTFVAIGNIGNEILLDSPTDYAYPAGSYVDIGEPNMAVDGSTTPVVFGVRNNAGQTPPPGLELSMDVTRVMFSCITSTAVDLSKFGDIAGGLTKGILLRKRDGTTYNIFNVKKNEGIAAMAYDFQVYSASNPQQGIDGFNSRLTFAGQNKMGVTVRLEINEDLELIVQDDLSSITSFQMLAEGSIVDPN